MFCNDSFFELLFLQKGDEMKEIRSFDFEVASAQTIDLRFTCTAKGPRIDNIKLTWQAE